MVQLSEIVRYCDDLLAASAIADYCPNGLQVEGRAEVARLVTGVTASRCLLDRAIELGADAVLVHHGYFWKGEESRVTGMKAARLRRLIRNDISLIAYHLPLDVHPVYGNNEQLARRLGLQVEGRIDAAGVPGLLTHGSLPEATDAAAFAEAIGRALKRAPTHVAGGAETVRRVAWCTGAGQRFLAEAAALGVDAFISGEISEPTAHEARELGVHYYAAGHHATERDGARALGEHLSERFGIEHRFVDVDNPA
ncbi:MAG TPA: Nif3-like dinuclear metal center hexameric protein [Gammaproteobacteria bacterium]|nr:Nif3-like dinuclear metal center hexameric protein [Gammaproteobacteria bacterium]